MILQIFAIFAVVALTYLFLAMLGSRPDDVFLSVSERAKWNNIIYSRVGTFAYVTNVSATLTSLATVYLFFIGTSPLFGYAIYISIFTIVLGSFLTPLMTHAVLKNPNISERMKNSKLSSVAISSIFWGASNEDKYLSKIIKFVTLTSIFSILWLEFAALTKLSGAIFGVVSPYYLAVMFFVAVVFVVDFTIRNGLRGFIFADLLQAPLIILGIIGLLSGLFIAYSYQPVIDFSSIILMPPKLPWIDILVFCVATSYLNTFILLCSESHWLRTWTMPNNLIKGTQKSGILTAGIWLLLIMAGLVGSQLTGGLVGEAAVIKLVASLSQFSVWFPIAFWIGATAAILSTSDGQLYSALVLISFDTNEGQVRSIPSITTRPTASALFVAIVSSIIFFAIEFSKFPFDQIVFFCLPFFLCISPSFIQILLGKKPTRTPIILSVILYALCGIFMIFAPSAYSMLLSLSAPLMPMLVSAALALRGAR